MVQRDAAGRGKEHHSTAENQQELNVIAKCQCQHCGGAIEFDAAEFVESGRRGNQILGQFVPCPHCGKNTIVSIENKSVSVAPPRPPASETIKAAAEIQSAKKSGAVLLAIGAAVLLIIGCVMVADGLNISANEQHPEAGAIRQITATVEAGLGVVVVALSLILDALVRIIRKP
jgi:hypothetical protein